MVLEEKPVETLVKKEADRIAKALEAIASGARSEEDVRHGCNKLIDEFIEEAELGIEGRHEYGIAGGRVDSKYSGVIIEYKNPNGNDAIGENADARSTRKLVEQIEGRFSDFEDEEDIPPEKLFGVGTDGVRIVFVQHRSGELVTTGPVQATPDSVQRVLRALVSVGARGKPFAPDQLAADFGASGPIGQPAVRALYDALLASASDKATTFFKQWRILFSEVCGYDVEEPGEKIQELAVHFGMPKDSRPDVLLFAVHTYFALFMKLLAAEVVSAFNPFAPSLIRSCLAAPSSSALKRELKELERGGIWTELGVTNFLEGDLFSWYLSAWNEEIAESVRATLSRLDEYDPATLSVDPSESRDLLKRLYQRLVPDTVRHDLGEYYTADWLAEFTLDEIGYDGNPDDRLLDPACGSGTFLVAAINRVKDWFHDHRHECGFDERGLVDRILANVVGFDLNPIAVLAARTNILVALRDLLPYSEKVELPVYLCDSVVTPYDYSAGVGTFKYRELHTAVENFKIPKEIMSSREEVADYARTLEFCVLNDYSTDEFIDRCQEEGISTDHRSLHEKLYERLVDLEEEDRNGVWARIIKNAFAPLFLQEVDFVAGNPPWINWENLPGEYRDEQKDLWEDYGLFSLSGTDARYGGSKKDLAMLFVYVAMDDYLSTGGTLGFVITQTVFKSSGAGAGFRRFEFNDSEGPVYIRPNSVHDMVSLKPFEGASNRTAVFSCRKQRDGWEYPVPYIEWDKNVRGAVGEGYDLPEALAATERTQLSATPVNPADDTSPWLTVPQGTNSGVQKVLGESEYEAHAGSCTWMNGVYWVRVLDEQPDGKLLIENRPETGRKDLDQIQRAVEPDLIYPLLRGQDVTRWSAEDSTHIVLAQDPDTRAGVPERTMKQDHPKTFAYFKYFEDKLRQRSGYKKYFSSDDPFWSIYNVGPYTVSPWKLVWREQTDGFQAAVIGPKDGGPVIPDHKLMLVACDSAEEAYYLSAVLNSAPSRLAIEGYVIETSTSTHVLDYVRVPVFDSSNAIHRQLSELAEERHSIGQEGGERCKELETTIDGLAGEIWDLDTSELQAIQAAVE